MKQLTKSIVLASALAIAGSAGASTMIDEVTPYVGADFKYMFLKGSGRPWNNNRNGIAGGTIYAGVRFCENFGLEAGYTFTANRSRSFSFTNGIYTTAGNVRSRLNNWHLDLMGFLCLDPCWELFGALGIGWVTPRARVDSLTITPVNPTSRAAIAALGTGRNSNTRAIARVGAGVQYMFTDCVYARGTIRWENTRNVRVDNGVAVSTPAVNTVFGGPFTNRPFRDTISLAIGLGVKF